MLLIWGYYYQSFVNKQLHGLQSFSLSGGRHFFYSEEVHALLCYEARALSPASSPLGRIFISVQCGPNSTGTEVSRETPNRLV